MCLDGKFKCGCTNMRTHLACWNQTCCLILRNQTPHSKLNQLPHDIRIVFRSSASVKVNWMAWGRIGRLEKANLARSLKRLRTVPPKSIVPIQKKNGNVFEISFQVPVVAVNIAEGIERWYTCDVRDTFLRRNFETGRKDCQHKHSRTAVRLRRTKYHFTEGGQTLLFFSAFRLSFHLGWTKSYSTSNLSYFETIRFAYVDACQIQLITSLMVISMDFTGPMVNLLRETTHRKRNHSRKLAIHVDLSAQQRI